MKYLRITAPITRSVTTAFVSSHPPKFISSTEESHPWEPPQHYCIYALRGRRDIFGSGFDYAVTSDTIRFYCIGHRYEMDPRQKYKEVAIAFASRKGDAVCGERVEGSDSIHLPLITDVSGNPVPKQLCREILQLSASSSAADMIRRNALLQMLFAELIGGRNIFYNGDPNIERVIQGLERHIHEIPNIDSLARDVHMSSRTLARKFKAITGKTIKQFLLARRIEIARQMLKGNPSLTTGEIASQLGFYDEYHFSHTFKKIIGVPPKRFIETGSKND